MDDGSLTSANLGNDHEIISEEYLLYWYEAFWGAQSKASRDYAQYNIVTKKIRNCIDTWYKRKKEKKKKAIII